MRAVGLHGDVIVAISRAYRTTCTLVRSGNEAALDGVIATPSQAQGRPQLAAAARLERTHPAKPAPPSRP